MGAEQALLALGMVGRWQVLTYTLTSFAYLLPGATTYYTNVIIWFAGHDFQCLKKNENLTADESFPVEIDPESGENLHSKCKRYASSVIISNITETCDAWTFNSYPFQWTAVIEWDLVCDKAAYLETAQLVIQLAAFGSFFLAVFPDLFGRSRSLLITQIIMTLFLVAASFATSPSILSALQFITMSLLSGSFMIGQVITTEIFPTDVRVYTAPVQDIFFQIVSLFWVLLLYLVRDLRKLQLVVACLSTITLFYYKWRPESVRWLVANKRYDEAQRILDKAARMNKVAPVPPSLLRATQTMSSRESLNRADSPTMMGFLRRGRTCRYFFTLLFMLLTSAVGFGGMNILIQLLSGDLFLNYIIFSLLGIPGVVVAMTLMHFFGRRYALFILFALAGILLATATVFHSLPADSLEPGIKQKLVTTFALLTTFAVNGMASGNNLFMQEIFPTAIRSTGAGILAGLSVGGGTLGPFLVLFLSRTYSVALPLGIMAALFLMGAVAALALPEVLGRPLPETIQEVESWSHTLNTEDWVKIKRDRSLLWQQIKQGPLNVQDPWSSQDMTFSQMEPSST